MHCCTIFVLLLLTKKIRLSGRDFWNLIIRSKYKKKKNLYTTVQLTYINDFKFSFANKSKIKLNIQNKFDITVPNENEMLNIVGSGHCNQLQQIKIETHSNYFIWRNALFCSGSESTLNKFDTPTGAGTASKNMTNLNVIVKWQFI